tara:strand:+ start:672 stop:1295 length:624 start_codon:yes stop_codon:yes gene_type:complete
MKLSEHHVVVDEITYDQTALRQLYQKMAHCALEWNEYKTAIKNRIGETHKHQGRTDGFKGRLMGVYSPAYEGKHMGEYNEVKDIVSKFNFLKPLGNDDITFMYYEPGFVFKPHTDRQMHYNIMLPILPDDGFEKITFWKGTDADRNNPKGKEYTYEYSHTHPSIFNGKTLHSVDEIKEERVMFRIKITHETFEEMIERYKAGKFINA